MMNTAMAPMEQIRQTLGELRRRHDSHHEISERRIDDRTGHVGIEKRKFFRNGNNNKDNDSNKDGGRSRLGGDANSNGYGNGNANDGSNDRPKFIFFDRDRSKSSSTPEATAPPEVIPTPSSTAAPDIRVETPPAASAAPTPSDPIPTSSSLPPETVPGSPTDAVRSSLTVPLLSSSTAPLEPFVAALPELTPEETTTQASKELSDLPTGTSASSRLAASSPEVTPRVSVLREAETALSATSAANAAFPSVSGLSNNNKATDSISPLAERLLIAAGAIGALIIILAAIYFILRLRNYDAFSIGPRRKSNKSQSGVWHGHRKRGQELVFEAPPRYSGEQGSYEYATVEKAVPSQREMEAFLSPKAIPSLAIPARAAALSIAETRRQDFARKPLPSNTEMLYNTQSQDFPRPVSDLNKILIQNGLLSRQISDLYNNTGTQNTLLTRPLSGSYNNTGTQVTLLTWQTTNKQNPSQREPNRMSVLSSLSSGFGDGLVISEGAATNSGGRHNSRNQRASRFSWQTSSGPRTPGVRSDRNSIYTTSSVDSAPRFRTVNSWVAQQTGRVEKGQRKTGEIPNMPAIPNPLRVRADHRRVQSDISAFQHHPGEEFELTLGSRVPSFILDRKIGHS